MCGIAGIYGHNARRWEGDLDAMLDKLSHRGPDDRGTYADENIAIGQTRLSIVDVAGGKQPIFSEDGRKCVVCNGEIYNYAVLKEELRRHRFRTCSDSEVIIHLFEEEGYNSVSRLDGMFAFVLYDGEDILVARDPLGIKPLYQGQKDGCLFFASEFKALDGVVHNIQEFPAGYYYSSKDGLAQYYRLPEVDAWEDNVDEITQMLRQLLSEAVQEGAAIDLEYARKVADFLGTDHHEYTYTKDEVLKALPQVIYHLESFDPALVRSAIPCYFVSRLASDYVKVILTGEGSDEVFAGYHYIKRFKNEEDIYCETVRILTGLHNMNLQRVDRATMAHSIEGRVPFLDIDFVEYVMSIDPSLKQAGKTSRIEKWLLRQAFSGHLPDEVLWRPKAEFAAGCGGERAIAGCRDFV